MPDENDLDIPEAKANPLAAIVRTSMPFATAWVVAYLARNGFSTVDPATVNGLVVAVGGSVYYTIVHLVEQKFPKAGYLLGIAKSPTYAPTPPKGA